MNETPTFCAAPRLYSGGQPTHPIHGGSRVLVYTAVGAIGLLFLLTMLFVGDLFGGDHDFDHGFDHDGDAGGGPSFFSARIIAAFMTAFGVGGVVARYYELSHPASSGVGVAAGFVMAGLVYQFARFLYS